MEDRFEVPILFLIFNRPDTTQIVFNQIKKIKPKYLFIAADGPRLNVADEVKKCEETRAIIKQINWDCELKTLFRDRNLGCGIGVSSAITWFFDNVEQGIILEDDCLPDLTFFEFTAFMLEKYKDNNKIKMISGTNYLFNKIKSKESYYFSKYYSIWGWATWKRAWNEFDFDIKSWPDNKKKHFLQTIFKNKKIYNYWNTSFDSVYCKKINTWDYQWAYSCLINNGLTVTPINNLVSNIGNFGTHGSGYSPFIKMQIKPFNIKDVIHPERIEVNNKLDKITYKNIGITRFNLFKKVWRLRFAVFKTVKKILFIKR